MNDTQKLRILSNSVEFSAGRPQLPAYKFSTTMATTYSTYRLGAVVSLIIWRLKICLPTLRHVYYGQTAGWIRMPLDTEVGLDPGDIVLDGDPAPPPRKRAEQPPLFSPLL